jgi:CheY-like chemotaxis protein
VKDSGPVIAAEARERLFRPFSRLGRPEGGDPVGTGLGLSICRHLVTLMGGEIGCDSWISDEGREGNVFWVKLPTGAFPPAAIGSVQTLLPPDLGVADIDAAGVQSAALLCRPVPRTRILVVEDITANQLVTATLLRREGHHVDIAASGPAAIEAIQAAPYDLVFMDIFMPGMSGEETTRAIRALSEPACSTPIIAVTARVGADDEDGLRTAGIDSILAKPVSLQRLLDVLREHVWSTHSPINESALSEEDDDMASVSRGMPILSAERINELRTNLTSETFGELIEECLVDMDHRLPALRRAIVAGAPAAITAQAHAMVGMAAGYGMAAVEARLRTIIQAARTGDVAALDSDINVSLEHDFAEAARCLREMLRREVV